MLKYLILILLFSFSVAATETVTLVAGESFPPLMWNEKGVAKGVAVELGKAILTKAGYAVNVKTCPWKRCQAIAEKDGAFITGFSKNDERLKQYIYSDVIMDDELVIVTRKGREFSLNDPNIFKSKTVGAALGVGYSQKNQLYMKGMKIESDLGDVARLKKLMLNRIDAGFFSLGKAGVAYSAKLAGYSIDNFSILPIIVSKDPNFLATGAQTINALEKMKKINVAIRNLNADGTIAKIIEFSN